jgi:hypothetical protein
MAAKLTFVASLQRGLNAGITRADQIVPVGPVLERQTIAATMAFGDTATSPNPKTSVTNLQLVGPGDVVGLDPRAVVRTYPRRDDNDAETEFFPMVEFDQADLPWRYTPAKPAGDIPFRTDRLRPWLSLIVLVEGEELSESDLKTSSLTQKLPTVMVKRKNLPSQSELWAWAHLQANDDIADATALDGALTGAPGKVVARIMSPRLLKKQKAYRAFLVPTFERGRLVGTGGTLTGIDALAPAWVRPAVDTDPANELAVELPYYYDWRFQTGTAGSFEALVSALAPGVLSAAIGRRKMDVSDPGLGGNVTASPAPMMVEGALQSVAAALAAPDPTSVTQGWIDHLKTFVDFSVMKGIFNDDGTGPFDVLVVAPPLYGRWYAAQSTLVVPPPNTTPLPWFYALNSDPRNRVAAALGTEVVQREQQSLMEAAWLQIDQLRSINQERKVLQAARQVFGRYLIRHVNVGFTESQFSLTSLLHGRILAATNTTVFGQFAGSPLPRAFFSPQWRRFTSARGFLGRRLGLPIKPVGTAPNIFARVNDGTVQLAPTPPLPAGLNGPEAIWGPAVGASLTNQQVTNLNTKLGSNGLAFWGLVLFWVGRKLLIDLNGQYWWLLHKLIRLGDSLIRAANDPQQLRETLRQALRTDTLQPSQVTTAPDAPTFTLKPGVSFLDPNKLPADPGALPGPGAGNSADATAFRTALFNLTSYLRRQRTQPMVTPVDLPSMLQKIMTGIAPGTTLLGSQGARVTFDVQGWAQPDQLEPIQAAPEIDRPMYEPLREISNDWILPGVGDVPDNTVSLVVSNQRFIEGFMAGLNHEMTRELIWNEYPVDQRGTYFRQFWDARAFVSGPNNAHTPEELKDIAPIRAWPTANGLGGNSPRPPVAATNTNPRVVLLVRGQLIKRYPNVIVYAANSPNNNPPPSNYEERHPIFHGFLGADVAYYAFDLTLNDVKDVSKHWYFVLQEQPAEPKFSVPETSPQPPDTVPYARATAEFAGDDTSAIIAAIGFRHPFRIAVTGSALTPSS